MPSPVAHAAMAVLFTPAARTRDGRTARWRLAAIVLMLCLPDADFVIGRLVPVPALAHGGAMHSVGFAVVGGAVFGLLATVLAGRWRWATMLRWSAIGVGCLGAHLLMDVVTWQARGLMLLWPLNETRYRLPFSIFYGARHSMPWAFHLHLVTLVTELVFGAAMFGLVRWWRGGGRVVAVRADGGR